MHVYTVAIWSAILWLKALAQAHPGVTVPVIGACVTIMLKPRSPAEYAAIARRNPVWLFARFAASLQLLGAIFPDPQKATKVLVKVITGKEDSTGPSA